MQPDDSIEVRAATSKLFKKGESDCDLYSDSARVIPVLFNSRSCTATEKPYHGFVGMGYQYGKSVFMGFIFLLVM